MKEMTPFEYRSYMIANEDGWFVAKALDGESGEIGSRHVLNVLRAIDALWIAIEVGNVPQWFSGEEVINLDNPVQDRLKLRATVRMLKGKAETTPSEVDPPENITAVVLTVLFAVGLATPIAAMMHQLVAPAEPAIIFTIAVMAIAVQFGALPAIAASVIAMGLYNVTVQDPVLTLSVPTVEEFVYTAVNIFVSVAIPWMIEMRDVAKRRSSGLCRILGIA